MSKVQQPFGKLAPLMYGTRDEFNPIYFFLLLLSILALYLKLITIARNKNKKLMNLPPSPPRLPIIGNLHQLSALIHRSLAVLSSKHGPLMLLQLGQEQALVVSSADMAREVMKTHDIAFSNRYQPTAAKILFYDCNSLVFSPYGEFWRQARKYCILELLSPKRVQSFQYVREEELQNLVKRLQSASLEGLCVNLSELLFSTSNNVVARCVLGMKFDDDENGTSEYVTLSKRVTAQLTAFCFADFFPSLRWIDVARGFIRKLKETCKDFDGFLDKLIEERKMKICSDSQDDQYPDEKDFVDILLNLQKDRSLNFELCNERVKAIIVDMLLAGSDTSAVSLEWTMVELIRNPTIMKKAQEEIRRVIGKKTRIGLSELNDMHYLECVIKESLRLHPPAPISVPRETSTHIKNMCGYEIPSKIRVIVNIYAIQRDPQLWKNPNDFIPERFMERSVDFKSQDNFDFIPFGGGRRGCPGLSFGITLLKFAVANLLYWFDWNLPDNCNVKAENLDMEESPGITISRKVPLVLKPVSYYPN